MINKEYKQLLAKALEQAEKAYAPYSKFKVGAVLIFDNNNTYLGSNVENASYGLSLCAERNAISTAIAQGETGNIKAIAIASPNTKMCVPCGACRQWLFEFEKGQNIQIILEDKTGEPKVFSIHELLPEGFSL